MAALGLTFGFLLAGSLVYCFLIIFAAMRFRRVVPRSSAEPVSVLKPLSGADHGLETNLRSFFEQDYADFELIFAVRTEDDAAISVVRKLQSEHPGVAARLIVTGEPPYANAKVFSIDRMLAEARYGLLVMSDSDIRVDHGFLASIAAEFRDPAIALATCPYRAITGSSIWSELEALGMNTEFWGGVLVARMIEGMKFAVGPTIVARREVFPAIGGCERLKDYLAEDFVMGKLAAEAGCQVILARTVVEHHIGSETWKDTAAHRLRWVRSTRRSRPAGYAGQIFTYPLPLALLFCAVVPSSWPVLLITLVCRGFAAWAVARRVLATRVSWTLLPLQDLLSFCFWIAGFFGNTIQWRGRRYWLREDGTFEVI